MGYFKKTPVAEVAAPSSFIPDYKLHKVDWARLVSLDFETYYDADYTLSKLSTSEYVRDPRFEALMCGIKIGRRKTVVVPGPKIKAYLAKIDWSTHSVLAHNNQFDGFILSHHYKIVPKIYYCTLSMARGLHSNEIGAGLDEVAKFYGRQGKIEGGVEGMKGLRYKELVAQKKYAAGAEYCGRDVDEMFAIFEEMVKVFPDDEMRLVDLTCRMFNDPVLCVNLPRVEAELARELEARRELLTTTVKEADYAANINKILKTKAERELTGDARLQLITRRVVGSNERFADLLRAEGVEPPRKISPAWMKKPAHERLDEDKWSYAFAKDDLDFTSLPDDVDTLAAGLDLNKKADVKKLAAKQARLRQLVDCRIAVKSTTNITRAQRFLAAGANGMRLPVGYAYARAHTLRFGGNNKMNMQNLTRGGELRLSIEAPKGYVLNVVDSGQIEARFSAWMWGQEDLLTAFIAADTWDKAKGVAHGDDRDAYCKFADSVYGFEVTTDNKTERFVGKVCIAEGQPVLTDRGLVPIEEVQLEDRLWDGVEWVRHAGVIDQGIKEVITYDGLTATPDHEVFTACGRILPLGQAASEMAWLQRTGVDGQAIRFCDAHVVADTPRKRLSVRVGEVLRDGHDEADMPRQPAQREDNFILAQRPATSSTCRSSGPAVRRDQSSVFKPNEPEVERLRRAGHQVLVHEPDGVHPVGVEEPTPRELCRGGDRPPQQRRALRAEEPPIGNQGRAGQKSTEHKDGVVGRQTSSARRVPKPVQLELDVEFAGPRTDWRPNTSSVRVYDIANAGPRLRYTVSGRLVFNCVLGLGYQMGPAKLQMTLAKGALGGPPVFFTLDECKKIVNTYRLKNHKIAAGWKVCDRIIADMAAGREGSHKCISWGKDTIYLPNGLALKYPQLRKAMGDKGWEEWSYQSGDQRKKIYGGLLAENLSQCLCRIIITEQMLAANAKYRVVMMTHDEIVILSKKAQAGAAQRFLEKVMKTPPRWCPDIPLNCEGGYAENYSK